MTKLNQTQSITVPVEYAVCPLVYTDPNSLRLSNPWEWPTISAADFLASKENRCCIFLKRSNDDITPEAFSWQTIEKVRFALGGARTYEKEIVECEVLIRSILSQAKGEFIDKRMRGVWNDQSSELSILGEDLNDLYKVLTEAHLALLALDKVRRYNEKFITRKEEEQESVGKLTQLVL